MKSTIVFGAAARAPRRKPVQRGVGLIEVLVAIVIFAFGMLGLAGMQTRTLWYGQSSLYRSQATALADDVFDRMRADRPNAKLGRWDTELASGASSISGLNLYQTDLKDWKTEVELLLPTGRARIQTVDDVITVTIEWDDSRGREGAQQFVTKSRL